MNGRLVVVTGTGTEIGKTHLSEALLLALGGWGLRVAGIKPVESGVGLGTSDAERLRRASTFHVKHSTVALRTPVSPHLAARLEDVVLSPDALARSVQEARSGVDVLLVELAGGLFSPLTDDALNADFATALAPDIILLVAPNRLGVLHDVLSTLLAASAKALRVDGLALVDTAARDLSSDTNAAELNRLARVPCVTSVPRAAPAVLAGHPGVQLMAERARCPRPDRARA